MPTDDMTIEQQTNQANGVSSVAPFFAVSLLKLVVLSVCTLAIYELYWFYRNWQLIKDRESVDISPVLACLLRVFILLPVLFARTRFRNLKRHLPSLPVGALAAGWIITTLTWKLPDPYGLISFFAFVFILPVQAYANRVNKVAAPQHNPNSRFTPWNWVGVVVGGLFVASAVVGTFMPEQ